MIISSMVRRSIPTHGERVISAAMQLYKPSNEELCDCMLWIISAEMTSQMQKQNRQYRAFKDSSELNRFQLKNRHRTLVAKFQKKEHTHSSSSSRTRQQQKKKPKKYQKGITIQYDDRKGLLKSCKNRQLRRGSFAQNVNNKPNQYKKGIIEMT